MPGDFLRSASVGRQKSFTSFVIPGLTRNPVFSTGFRGNGNDGLRMNVKKCWTRYTRRVSVFFREDLWVSMI